MNIVSRLNIRKHFINDEEYKNFSDTLSFHMNEILSIYSFLGLSEEEWIKIIESKVNEKTAILMRNLIQEIKNSLSLYIKNEIDLLRPRIISNLLIKNVNEFESMKDIFAHFKKDLDAFHIIISLPFYELLRNEPIFKMLFNERNISYHDFTILITDKCNLYYEFLVFNRDILWTIQQVDNILSLINKKITKLTLNEKITIKFILDFYDYILKIAEYLKKCNINMTKNDIMKTLFNFSSGELDSLKKELISFDEAKPMPDFLSKIYRKFANLKDLYERFPLKDGQREEQRKIEIDSIIEEHLSLERKRNLFGYLNGELSREESNIYSITRFIKRYYLGESKTKTDFYEKFPLKDGKNSDDRKKEVDNLINTLLTKEDKGLLEDCIAHRLTDKKKKNRVKGIIMRLKRHYLGEAKRNPIKTFYDRFPLKKGNTNNMRKEKVDSLINEILTEEEKAILNSFIAKKLKSDDDKKKAKAIIERLKYHYKKSENDKLYENPSLKPDKIEKISLLIKMALENEERDVLLEYPNSEEQGIVMYIFNKLKKYSFGSGEIKKVILWILNYCNWQVNVSEEKFDLLFGKLKLIEFKYKLSKEHANFEDVSLEILLDIFGRNTIFTFESLINEYIVILTDYLKQKEDIRTRC